MSSNATDLAKALSSGQVSNTDRSPNWRTYRQQAVSLKVKSCSVIIHTPTTLYTSQSELCTIFPSWWTRYWLFQPSVLGTKLNLPCRKNWGEQRNMSNLKRATYAFGRCYSRWVELPSFLLPRLYRRSMHQLHLPTGWVYQYPLYKKAQKSLTKTYEGSSESNASCFITLTHDVRGRCWRSDSRSWIFPPISR